MRQRLAAGGPGEQGASHPDSPERDRAAEDTEYAAAIRANRRRRIRLYLTYLPLLVMVVLAVWLMAEGIFVLSPMWYGPLAGVGPDFGMFYSAARVLATGHNPYDPGHLAAIDPSVMHAANLPVFPLRALVRVGNPPLFFWLMGPLATLPYRTALFVWIALLVAALAAGSLASLRYFRWTHAGVAILIFLVPSVDNALRTANVVPFVFAGIGGALALVRRFPLLAGAALTLAWLKPQVGLPLAGLVILFHSPAPRRVLAGFAATTLAETILTILTAGTTPFRWWMHSFTGYSNSITIQGDIASLTGIYYRWAPAEFRLSLQVATVLAAVAVTYLCWRRGLGQETPMTSVAWLWFLWFLATPYDLFDDQMLLAIPVLALLGRNGSRLASPLAATILYAVFLCVVPFNISPARMQLLWLPILIAGICAGVAAAGSRDRDETGLDEAPADR